MVLVRTRNRHCFLFDKSEPIPTDQPDELVCLCHYCVHLLYCCPRDVIKSCEGPCILKYTVYGRHFAGKMWASAGMVMMNQKGLAMQSSSPSHKVSQGGCTELLISWAIMHNALGHWRNKKETHTKLKGRALHWPNSHWLDLAWSKV